MQFKLAIFATLSIIFSVALASPSPRPSENEHYDDNQNENVNVNENNNQQDEYVEHDYYNYSEILDSFCNRDSMGNLQLLGKRDEVLAKRDLQGIPGFENFDFNNNQNANVNQNALLNDDVSQQFDRFGASGGGHGGDFINGIAGAGIGGLVDCFLGDSGELVEGRRMVRL